MAMPFDVVLFDIIGGDTAVTVGETETCACAEVSSERNTTERKPATIPIVCIWPLQQRGSSLKIEIKGEQFLTSPVFYYTLEFAQPRSGIRQKACTATLQAGQPNDHRFAGFPRNEPQAQK
jgi:hypothetical protein